MSRSILLVFENEKVLPEALIYAREFAMRIDAKVTLLMIEPMLFEGRTVISPKRNSIRNIEIRAGKVLSDCLQGFIQEGIEVNSALKIGDPAQELMKFLADRPPFQAIVWGSGHDLPDKGRGSQRHWMSRVVGSLECPLLAVSKR
ncbi:MAG: universal stress protein [Desulfobacteraceae bacterium]|nr:universal stress protein [Desulfobacteraceae bacterium]